MSLRRQRVVLFLAGALLLLLPVLLLHQAERGFIHRIERQEQGRAEERLRSTLEMFRRAGSSDALLAMRLQGIVDQFTASAALLGPRPGVAALAEIGDTLLVGPAYRDLSIVSCSLVYQSPLLIQGPMIVPATFSRVQLAGSDPELASLSGDLLFSLCASRNTEESILVTHADLDGRFQKAFSTSVGLGLLSGKFRGRAVQLFYRGRPCWLFWQILQPANVFPRLASCPKERWFEPRTSRFTYQSRTHATLGGLLFIVSADVAETPEQRVVSSFDDSEVAVALFPEDGGKPVFSRRFSGAPGLKNLRPSSLDAGVAGLRQMGMLVATGTAFFSRPFRLLVGTSTRTGAAWGWRARDLRLGVGWAGFAIGVFLLGWALFADRGITGTLRRQLLGGFFLMLLLPSATVFWITEDLAEEQLEALEQQTRAELRRGMNERQQRFVAGRPGEWQRQLAVFQEPRFAAFLDRVAAEWRAGAGKLASETARQLKRTLKERIDSLRVGTHPVIINSMGVSGFGGFSIEAGVDEEKSEGELAETFSRLSVPILRALNPGEEASEAPATAGGLKRGTTEEMAADVIREVVLSCLGPEGYYSLVYGLGNDILVRLGVAFSHFTMIPIPSLDAPKYQTFTLYSSRGADMAHVSAALAGQSGSLRYYACDFERIGGFYHPDQDEGKPLLRKAAALTRLVQEPQSLRLRHEGEEYLVETALNFPNHQFLVLGTAPEKPLRERVEGIKRVQQVILLFSLLLTWVLAWISARDILRPVNSLAERMNSIWQGDFSVRIQETRADELGLLCGAFNRMAKGLEEGKLLGRMVSTRARRALEDGAEIPGDEGRRCEVTVLYLGFGDLEERSRTEAPERLIETLDRQVRETCRAILAMGGDVDKVMGDKVLAIFPHGDKPAVAVASAVAVLGELDRSRRSGQLPLPFAAGLNCGVVIAGFLGSTARRDHTVIGDPVNLAARCESLAERDPAAPWVCSEAVRALLPPQVRCEELPVTSVKGKTEAVRLFRMVSFSV